MARIIAALNMTIDGVSDHTAGLPDEEIHDHYTEMLGKSGMILYGRTTYELMKYWQQFLDQPTGEKSKDDFAQAIDRVPKIVFSSTLSSTGWSSAKLATKSLEDTVKELKQTDGKDVMIGSRSLINQLMKLKMIDELQLCIYPVINGTGQHLFESDQPRTIYRLIRSRHFQSGAVIHFYQPA